MTFSNLHDVTHSILPREQEAACSSAGGGAELAIAGCPALYLTGDLTHDGPGHCNVMDTFYVIDCNV